MTPQALHRAFRGTTKKTDRAALRARHQASIDALATDYLDLTAPSLCARHRLSGEQEGIVVLTLLLCLSVGFLHPVAMAVTLNAVFILFALAAVILRAVLVWIYAGSRRDAPTATPLADEDLPTVTVLCPLFREAQMVAPLVAALERLDYPIGKLDVKLLMEAEDLTTIDRARAIETDLELDIVVVPAGAPQTKPRACNHGLWSARGDLLVIYDAEDEPEPEQLRKAAAVFAANPPEVVCLQARLNYRGREQNWLTRMFAAEYALLFDLVLPSLDRLGLPLPLGGTSNIFRTSALIALGGWDAYNVTEDADLGLRLAHRGWRAKVLDSTTYEVPMADGRGWIRQRSRWIKGYMQCWAVHTRRRPGRDGWRHAVTLHLIVGAVVVAALLNPIVWTIFIAGYLYPALDLGWLFPGPLGVAAIVTLVVGNAFQLWMFMLAPLRRGWLDLVPFAATVPVYWVMQSIAGYRAAAQLLTAPHYWEKTEHQPIYSVS